MSLNQPTRKSAVVFRAKALALQRLRSFRDLRDKVARYPIGDLKVETWIEHRSPLFTSDNPAELGLQLGKIQNLRVAIRGVDGIVVPAGEVFSFWKHVGRATKGRGFADGRELRGGCIIPTIGGGLCQLSNALYDLALRAELEVLERHAHSQVVPGSAVEAGRDATVAWNYIDLRFRSARPYQIKAKISREELVVSFGFAELVHSPDKPKPKSLRVINTALGSCETCGEHGCFRHEETAAVKSRSVKARTAFLLDSPSPEFAELLPKEAKSGDVVMIPIDGKRWRMDRYAWPVLPECDCRTATTAALKRMVNARKKLTPPQTRALQIEDADRIARVYADRLPFDVTNLVVDLTFLKELHRQKALGGRGVTVWLNRFPLKVIHELLDAAAKRYPDFPRLADFRADEDDLKQEWEALSEVDKIVTSHSFLADYLRQNTKAQVTLLDWKLGKVPEVAEVEEGTIFFPGPTAAREGAIAVREAAKTLGLKVSIGGRNLEGADFWEGVECTVSIPMSRAEIVVCPAVMKNRPDALLRAQAMGKPIIATRECGLAGVIEVPFGDAEALVEAIQKARSSKQ